MTNVEVKCRLADRAAVEVRLPAIGARRAWTRRQRDTFFAVPGRWLKLREETGAAACLIAYARSVDDAGPRESEFERRRLDDAAAWLRLLGHVLPVDLVVEKERTLWLHGHTRIHLDRVDGLGDYVELETAVVGITRDEADREARALVGALGLDAADFLARPYRDLLAAERRT